MFGGVLSVVSWQHLADSYMSYVVSHLLFFLLRKKSQKSMNKSPHHEARIKEKALVDFLREMKEVGPGGLWPLGFGLGPGP